MKKAIIIGATSGIGKELAKVLILHDYKVGITGRRNDKLLELQAENPENYITSCFDCTLENNTEKLSELATELGGIDLLILSSGIEFQHLPQGFYITFVVDNVDDVFLTAQSEKMNIISEPTDTFYGQRRLLLKDPNGTLVDVSSPIKNFEFQN